MQIELSNQRLADLYLITALYRFQASGAILLYNYRPDCLHRNPAYPHLVERLGHKRSATLGTTGALVIRPSEGDTIANRMIENRT